MNNSIQNETAGKISVKEVNLPKGGGAIKGLGDSFKANSFTGAGSYSIAVPVTSARGFEPQLSIMYSSGGGNGIFGLGFSLSLSKISTRTNKGIPKYDETDTFEIDGEVLVKEKDGNPNLRTDVYNGQNCQVTTYLPQLQGAYAQIEHWQNTEASISFWKVISADNTTSLYGITSQISNPDNPSQIFEWLIDRSVDNKGNEIIYNYVAENATDLPHAIYEINRNISANRYISTIQYGNYAGTNGGTNFAFEIVFNYGEPNLTNPQDGWACRPDIFSTYNSGFEIRTYRLCQKVQLVHLFPDELTAPLIVKELAFTYKNVQEYTPVSFQAMSLLSEATLRGFRKELNEPQSMAPVAFYYSSFQPSSTPEFKLLSMVEGTIPGYLDYTQFLPVDLNGEGLPGFLISNNEYSYYLEPIGDGYYRLPVSNADFPISRNVQAGEAFLADIDGNGALELITSTTGAYGYYERTSDSGWNNFVAFKTYPNATSLTEMESADLAANGKSDFVLAGKDNIIYYPSTGKSGYGASQSVINENNLPLIKPGDKQELVTFSNIFGDGLSHRVKISNGTVECWPCLGYGRFGKKVTLANAPVFDEDFDTDRLFLADIDGSGTTDFIYVHPDRVELFMNQSGNSFSDAITIQLPELYGLIDKISFSDILGNGTSCLVFTKMGLVPVHYYFNFSGEIKLSDGTIKNSLKPYLLNEIDNNMGTVNYINYSSSTKFLLEDKLAGRPWATKLPMPVQVVEELIQYESFSKSRYVSRYKYHDGYYDAYERQFKGFGFVESWDTETYEDFQQSYSNPDYPTNELNKELFVPAAYTKIWYLNGSRAEMYEQLLAKYKSEYFSKDAAACNFPDSLFSSEIMHADSKTFMEAYRALASCVLRKEVYSCDESLLSAIPYAVEESNYEVQLLQPATEDTPAVFKVDPRENIKYSYERSTDDPRVEQQFVLETDPLCGKPVQAVTIYLSRRGTDTSLYPEQYIVKGVVTMAQYYNSPDDAVTFRQRGIKYDEQNFNLLGLTNPASGYYTFGEIYDIVQAALGNIISYPATPSVNVQAERLNWTLSYFWETSDGKVGAVLPLGQISRQALLHHVSKVAFTTDDISAVFGQRLTQDAIEELGGYIYDDITTKAWVNEGLIQNYNDADAFYLSSGTVSSSTNVYMESAVSYDAYYLAAASTTAYISKSPLIAQNVLVTTDYQAMAPMQTVDINGNVTQVLYDAMGQVIVSSLFGKEDGQERGNMRLYEYNGKPPEYVLRQTTPDGKPIDFNSVIDSQNREYYLQGAGSYFYYNTHADVPASQPVCSIGLACQDYFHNPGGPATFACQILVSYNDGLGRALAKKMEAEGDGPLTRWLTTGRTVYNNKGKVCELYLPYFSNTPFYETQDEITSLYKLPPPTITHYDPLLRVIKIDTPKGFFSKTDFTPWEQIYSDEDDTVTDSIYYQNFINTYPTDPTPEQEAEWNALYMAKQFYGTPSTKVLDNAGNTIRNITILKDAAGTISLTTFFSVDIEGKKLVEIDPRLYESNLSKSTTYYNFKYRYNMDSEQPVMIDSADAGTKKNLNNIFGKPVWSLSPRDYCQITYYDWLQRQTQLYIKCMPGTAPIVYPADFSLVEVTTYGDDTQFAEGYNLRGQIHVLKDLSGIVTNNSYSMLGKVLDTGRQMTSVYKTAVNWDKNVPLDADVYVKIYTYDALTLLLTETTKNNTGTWNTLTNTYNLEGLLKSASLTTDTSRTGIINSITYNANRQRKEVSYENGITTKYSYEESTLRLIKILSQAGAVPPFSKVQDIYYAYDPVGIITYVRDSSIETVFNNNQKIDPVSTYNYDSLYRLIQAAGRQHPGITASTYKNNSSEGSFMQSIYTQSPVSDGQAIERYTEAYYYDHSNNLLKKVHSASQSWTTPTPVLDYCNKLQGIQYDASGNQVQLMINSAVPLKYNCCENLISATVIERPGEANDSEYYVYDHSELRTRKVNEQYIDASSASYRDTVYFNDYEVLREGIQLSDGTRTVTTHRQTLRIMDGNKCIAILYHWVSGGPGSSPGNPAPDQLRYQMDNNIGSVSVELDKNGALISYEEYFPYGGTSFIAGPNQVDVSLKVYRYSGKECDNSTGLYYYGMRYYVSWLGRWLKPDPAGTVDGLNLYEFVSGNPITHKDENGLSIWEWYNNLRKGAQDYAYDKVVEYAPKVGRQVADVVKSEGGDTLRRIPEETFNRFNPYYVWSALANPHAISASFEQRVQPLKNLYQFAQSPVSYTQQNWTRMMMPYHRTMYHVGTLEGMKFSHGLRATGDYAKNSIAEITGAVLVAAMYFQTRARRAETAEMRRQMFGRNILLRQVDRLPFRFFITTPIARVVAHPVAVGALITYTVLANVGRNLQAKEDLEKDYPSLAALLKESRRDYISSDRHLSIQQSIKSTSKSHPPS